MHAVSKKLRGGVVAIGNFDGVHRGHQSVLCAAVKKAKALDCPALALTFEPHPRTVFQPETPVFRLTPAPLKAELVEKLGFDAIIEQTFDRAFSAVSAAAFVEEGLVDALDIKHAVTGYDFNFGKGRQGSPDYLETMGKSHGFGVTVVDAFADADGEVISSSRIRALLAQGHVAAANGLLGYVWCVSSLVIPGKQLGRTLGYPTANIALPPEATLAHGIYAVRVRLQDDRLLDGVASYGRRPTFDDGAALLETFIFDFSEDIYAQEITVHLHGWLRGEEKFDSAEALVVQMDKDSAHAKALLATVSRQSLAP